MSRLKMIVEIKKKNRVITTQRAKVNEVVLKNTDLTFVVKNLKGQIKEVDIGFKENQKITKANRYKEKQLHTNQIALYKPISKTLKTQVKTQNKQYNIDQDTIISMKIDDDCKESSG